ncbi:hypothetical protein NKH03_29475 [Mesorhizobium sp. M1406]
MISRLPNRQRRDAHCNIETLILFEGNRLQRNRAMLAPNKNLGPEATPGRSIRANASIGVRQGALISIGRGKDQPSQFGGLYFAHINAERG